MNTVYKIYKDVGLIQSLVRLFSEKVHRVWSVLWILIRVYNVHAKARNSSSLSLGVVMQNPCNSGSRSHCLYCTFRYRYTGPVWKSSCNCYFNCGGNFNVENAPYKSRSILRINLYWRILSSLSGMQIFYSVSLRRHFQFILEQWTFKFSR